MRTLRYLAGAMALALMVAGCGAPSPVDVRAGSTDAIGSSKIKPTWMLIDSSSFHRYAAHYLPEMEAVARDVVAPAHGRILAASVDGSPLTTAELLAVDFSKNPVAVNDSDLFARFNQARAAAFGHRFRQLVAAHQTVRGSGLLEALALTTSAPGDVYLWSDGVERVGGFDLSHATRAELDHEISVWTTRLRGQFHGQAVTLIGVGRGIHDVSTVRRAHELFTAVVEEAGGGKLRWVQTLAEGLAR